MSIYYFFLNSFVIKHFGENEIPIFFGKSDFFLNPIFFPLKSDFFGKSTKKSIFFF